MRPTIRSTALGNGLVRHATAMLGRLRFSENAFLALIAVGVGIVAGLANYAFRHTIKLIHWLVIEQGQAYWQISFEHWSPSRLWSALFPLTGGLLLIPFWLFFGQDMRSGFADFLQRVNLRGAKIPAGPFSPAAWPAPSPSAPAARPARKGRSPRSAAPSAARSASCSR
jgi:H+/Cl- antiporter ClcA